MKKQRSLARSVFIFCCLAPSILLFTIFVLIPTTQIFYMSVFKSNALTEQPVFVQFNNFVLLLKDKGFIQSFQNTILMIVFATIITCAIAVIFASIMITEKIKGNSIFRVIFYIPNILSIVIISGIFSAIYAPSNGLLSSIMNVFNFDSPKFGWLGTPGVVVYAIIGALIWQAIGYYMVMYMAGIAAIPDSLYEAADLDGAGRLNKFFNVTLPLVWNSIRTTLTFFVVSTINLSFLLSKVLTDGGPQTESQVVLGHMYKEAYNNGNYGYAMAMGVVIFVFALTLAGVVSRAAKRPILEF